MGVVEEVLHALCVNFARFVALVPNVIHGFILHWIYLSRLCYEPSPILATASPG